MGRAPRRRSVPPRRRPRAGRGDRPKVTDWVQSGAALLAVVVAAPALWVGVATYQDQIRVTEAQLEATQLERRRYQERYAGRVSFWSEWVQERDGEEWLAVRLQNRAPVPVNWITFLAHIQSHGAPGRGYVGFTASREAPPCSILTYRLYVRTAVGSMPGFASLPRYELQDPEWLTVSGIQFYDTVLWWEHLPESNWLSRTPGGPRALAPEEHRRYPQSAENAKYQYEAKEVAGTRQSIGDCGESG